MNGGRARIRRGMKNWRVGGEREKVYNNHDEAKALFQRQEKRMGQSEKAKQHLIETVEEWKRQGYCREVEVKPQGPI